MIAYHETGLDLHVAHEQQGIVSGIRRQTHAEAIALARQNAQEQGQLREARRQERDLQRQLDSALPMH